MARKLDQPIVEEMSWVVRTVEEEEKDFLILSEVDEERAVHVPVPDPSAFVKHHPIHHCH